MIDPKNQREAIAYRVATKGVRCEDIRHPGRLSEEDIAGIEPSKVYEWVKTGAWKKKDFMRWLDAISYEEE